MKEYEHKNKVVGTLPVLPVNNVAETLKYYKETLGFHELFSQTGENNILINSQVRFENNSLMLNYNPEEADKKGGGVFFWMRIEDRDIDEYYQDLCDKNVKIAEEIKDQFWEDRSFTIIDFNGYLIAFNQSIS